MLAERAVGFYSRKFAMNELITRARTDTEQISHPLK